MNQKNTLSCHNYDIIIIYIEKFRIYNSHLRLITMLIHFLLYITPQQLLNIYYGEKQVRWYITIR